MNKTIDASDNCFDIKKQNPKEKVIALAGNPNVGKSTVFNALTGMRQHTGNWAGKTVSNAQGRFETEKNSYSLVDMPGTYSLLSHSAEEETARNFLCFASPSLTVVVCDATCLERNMNLALQIMEISGRVLVCVNLMDEARKKHIELDLPLLSQRLGVPVVGISAHKKKDIKTLIAAIDAYEYCPKPPLHIDYNAAVEMALHLLIPVVAKKAGDRTNPRWLSLRMLDMDAIMQEEIEKYFGKEFLADEELKRALAQSCAILKKAGINCDELQDIIASAIVKKTEQLCRGVVQFGKAEYNSRDRKLDRLLTGKYAAYPLMLALLALIFWLTVSGANYPSQLLSTGLFWFENRLTELFSLLNAPDWLYGVLVEGVYRVLAWVVSVMLPPMAIFFPLFTLLEDSGYLPRIAYNLDKPFKACHACGKQALTMCMEQNAVFFIHANLNACSWRYVFADFLASVFSVPDDIFSHYVLIV